MTKRGVRYMVRRKTVNKQIKNREGFDVIIKRNGRAVRQSVKLPRYRYQVALKNARNVKAWREIRFKRRYPGYEVDVLYAERKTVKGKPVKRKTARGGTLLGTVRDSYLLED